MDGKEYSLLVYLSKDCRGKGKAVTGKHLAIIFNLNGTAEVRRLVNSLRVQGYPIGSCSTGYYFMSNPQEVDETLAGLWGRIDAMMMAVDGLEAARAKMRVNNFDGGLQK